MTESKTKHPRGYDIIGDVHGRLDTLQGLLRTLGYRRDGAFSWKPPEGRRAVFLGDLVDRGPLSAETALTVRKMCRDGRALCVMGNHEYNVVCWSLRRSDGSRLRPHGEKNRKQIEGFLNSAGDGSPLHRKLSEWFATLPLWLDLGPFCCAHACPPASLADRCGGLLDAGARPSGPEFFIESRREGTEAFGIVNRVLKGPSLRLPQGVTFHDRYGVVRNMSRMCWWQEGGARTWRSLAAAGGADLSLLPDTPVPEEVLKMDLPDKPAFFGHYGLPPEAHASTCTNRAVCLDFRAGTGGPLTAYRWNEGDEEIIADRVISVFP